jgi:hypothetical protein
LTYRLFIEKSAQKNLDKLTNPDQDKIINAIQNLSEDQRPSGVKKLSGRNAWRIRIGEKGTDLFILKRYSSLLIGLDLYRPSHNVPLRFSSLLV